MGTLAIDGGTPVRSNKPRLVETDIFEQEELDALVRVATQKKLRRAEVTLEYEKSIAEYFGAKHAIAVSSGTTALHIALAAFGIGPGDEVIVSPYTFIASDTCVLEQNAVPIFADVDPRYLTLDPADIERKITKHTKAIIPVHILGAPVDLDPIMALAEKHNLWVLEDGAQSPGATCKGKRVGTIGHVGAFSTISGKITSTGEGGFVTTNDDELFEKMWGYQDFARRRSMGAASKFHWGLPCTNYRITNMQAAIGLEQMQKIDRLIAKRGENARYLDARLKGLPGISSLPKPDWGESVYYYYAIRIQRDVLGTDMLNFAVALAAEGVYDLGYLIRRAGSFRSIYNPFLSTNQVMAAPNVRLNVRGTKGMWNMDPGCARKQNACEEVFWLSSVNPLLEQQDLDDIATAVEKVATAFVEKKRAGIPIRYATDDQRDRIEFMERVYQK